MVFQIIQLRGRLNLRRIISGNPEYDLTYLVVATAVARMAKSFLNFFRPLFKASIEAFEFQNKKKEQDILQNRKKMPDIRLINVRRQKTQTKAA